MREIIRIEKVSKLSEPNVNGISYEQESLKAAIDRFLENPQHIDNVVQLYASTYENRQTPDFYMIDMAATIGRCIAIEDDYIEVELSISKDDFNSRFNVPKAMLRMMGTHISKTLAKVDLIIAIDVKEENPIVEEQQWIGMQ